MQPVVGIVMGSASDWETMKRTCEILEELGIPYEKQVLSGHRTPKATFLYAEEARKRGLKVIIAGAGGAAHLGGMLAARTTLPVIGVPVEAGALAGLDALLSTVQMPAGIPVGTVAIGPAGAANAAWYAAQILSIEDRALAQRLCRERELMEEKVKASNSQLI